jgi:hypothetical protein
LSNKFTKNRVFVGGVGRSGTTWCAQIINASSNYVSSFEPYFRLSDLGLGYSPFLTQNDALNSDVAEVLCNMVTISNESRPTLVKEIRCNLMLAWLQQHSPLTHLVYIIRNPLQVACSWKKLNWGKALRQDSTDIELLNQQQSLIDSHPVISEAYQFIDCSSPLESAIFVWCVHHLVVSLYVKSENVHLLYYENLLLNPKPEIKNLYEYLGQSFDWNEIKPKVEEFSSSTMAARKKTGKTSDMIDGWKTTLTRDEINRCQQIIDLFGLGDVYLPNGLPSELAFFQN